MIQLLVDHTCNETSDLKGCTSANIYKFRKETFRNDWLLTEKERVYLISISICAMQKKAIRRAYCLCLPVFLLWVNSVGDITVVRTVIRGKIWCATWFSAFLEDLREFEIRDNDNSLAKIEENTDWKVGEKMNKTEIIRFRVSKEELKLINHRALAGTAIVESPPACRYLDCTKAGKVR